MANDTRQVKLGVCHVLFDGVDLGLTKGGVEVEVTTMKHDVTVDQFGETAIGALITGRNVKVTAPLAETTLETLVEVMPGAVLTTDGAKATGTITFTTAAASANDVVTVNGIPFTFKASPGAPNEVAPGASFTNSAANLAAAINLSQADVKATVAAGVVTVTFNRRGAQGNAVTLAKTGTNIAVSGATLTGGQDPTRGKVVVSTGVNVNLLAAAKKLVLRPRGTYGSDDFILHKASCVGGLNFAYGIDKERLYPTEFTGFADGTGLLFTVGDEGA